MNSMPETNQIDDQINDTIVEAAMIALAAFHPETPEQAADMLLFWIRRHEMTDADMAEVTARMFPKPLPLMECPAWCDGEHPEKPNEIEDLSDHYHDLLEERDESGRLKLWVAIQATDELADRRRNGPGILVQADEALSPDQAIRLVGAIAEGLRILANA